MIRKHNFNRAKVHTAVTPGEALRMLRELQGISQNELALLTGVAQSNISAIEKGSKHLGRERSLVFAKVLRVHPAVLLFPDFDIAEAV